MSNSFYFSGGDNTTLHAPCASMHNGYIKYENHQCSRSRGGDLVGLKTNGNEHDGGRSLSSPTTHNIKLLLSNVLVEQMAYKA